MNNIIDGSEIYRDLIKPIQDNFNKNIKPNKHPIIKKLIDYIEDNNIINRAYFLLEEGFGLLGCGLPDKNKFTDDEIINSKYLQECIRKDKRPINFYLKNMKG